MWEWFDDLRVEYWLYRFAVGNGGFADMLLVYLAGLYSTSFTSWVVAVFGDIFDGREYQKERTGFAFGVYPVRVFFWKKGGL